MVVKPNSGPLRGYITYVSASPLQPKQQMRGDRFSRWSFFQMTFYPGNRYFQRPLFHVTVFAPALFERSTWFLNEVIVFSSWPFSDYLLGLKKSCLVGVTRQTLKNRADPKFFFNFGAVFPVFHNFLFFDPTFSIFQAKEKKIADLPTLFFFGHVTPTRQLFF